MKKKYHTIILGAGLTGLSIARNLKADCLIIEKSPYAGGLCRSVRKDGFIFDYTGHLLHLRNEWAQRFVFNLLKKNIIKVTRNSWIYSVNTFTRYPYQMNLYGLPPKIIKECIDGLIKSQRNNSPLSPIPYSISFYDWSLRTFGSGITKHFLKPYNEKLWGISVKKLTAEWVEKFVPRPKLAEVLAGSRTDLNKKIGYNASFFYPRRGGIQSLINEMLKNKPNILYNTTVSKIDLKNKNIVLSSGKLLEYENLVSTIPLPELLICTGYKNLAEKLDWTSVLCFNIGVRGDVGHNRHWVYFPEKKFIFYRVGFYSNINKSLAPPEHYSMYVEVSCHRSKKMNLAHTLDKVVTDLSTVGFLRDRKNVVTLNILPIKYGYVIYDRNRTSVVNKAKEILEKNNVYLAGRFGAWKYSYMEESILDAKSLADMLNSNT